MKSNDGGKIFNEVLSVYLWNKTIKRNIFYYSYFAIIMTLCLVSCGNKCDKFYEVNFSPSNNIKFSCSGGSQAIVPINFHGICFDAAISLDMLPSNKQFYCLPPYQLFNGTPDAEFISYYQSCKDSLGIIISPEPFSGKHADAMTLTWNGFQIKVSENDIMLSADENPSPESREVKLYFHDSATWFSHLTLTQEGKK